MKLSNKYDLFELQQIYGGYQGAKKAILSFVFWYKLKAKHCFFDYLKSIFSKISAYFLVLHIFIVLYYSNTQQTEEEREKKPKQNTF